MVEIPGTFVFIQPLKNSAAGSASGRGACTVVPLWSDRHGIRSPPLRFRVWVGLVVEILAEHSFSGRPIAVCVRKQFEPGRRAHVCANRTFVQALFCEAAF